MERFAKIATQLTFWSQPSKCFTKKARSKKVSFISGNGKPKKLLIFQEVTFQAQKAKKYLTKKNLLHFRKWGFLALENLIKLFYTLNKILLGETGCLRSLYYLLTAQASSFLIQAPFPNKVSQDTFGILLLSQDTFGTLLQTVQYLCDFWVAMPRHWSPSASYPTLSREAEDYPRGGKYPKDVPLSTFLATLQPV